MFKYLKKIVPKNKNGIQQCATINSLRMFSQDTEEIVIPKAIPRGPTDILRALSSTVRPDPTAAHYKFHDDPYLIPYSNLSKRSYALSQEAGRKAAQWIRQQHPELFQHRVAEPIVQAFLPKPEYKEDSVVNEDILKNSILNVLVTDSINIYNILKKNGVEISHETKQNLLELVCFYNCEDALTEDWIEERWYRQGMKSKERRRNFWKDGSFAEQLFNELGGKDSKSVCALISGMCLHGQLDRAWLLYEQALKHNIKLNTIAYNSLLSKSCFLVENNAMAMAKIQNLLLQMSKDKIKPDLGTLNSVLESLSNLLLEKSVRTFALETLAEFNTLKIKPSLATFYHLINIFYSDSQLRAVLTSTLIYLEDNPIEIKDVKDVIFFSKAMESICHRLSDKDLAYRLDDLLQKNDNYNFIGDSLKESLYYRYYFLLLCKAEPLDVFMEIYDNLAPNIYVPEPIVMKEILTALEYHKKMNLLPRLWSDIILFEQDDRANTFEHVISLAAMNSDESLNLAMANIGWSMWEKLENNQKKHLKWTVPLLGDLLVVLLAAGDLSKAHLVLDKLVRLQNEVTGEPKVSALAKYLDACIAENSPDAAIKCIKYCNDMSFKESTAMGRKLFNSLQLKEQQLERLSAIVGKDALGIKEMSKVEN